MDMRYMKVLLIGLAAVLVVVPAVAVALPSLPSSGFPTADGCGCHGELPTQWGVSMHAKALVDPIYLVKLREADAATGGEVTPFCLMCHSPVGVMAGELSRLDHTGASPAALEGVACTFCHHTTGTTTPVGNASQEVSPDDVRLAQLKDPQAPHAAAYSAFHETAEFCGTCHNVNHPTNGTHLEATYTEWKESPYAAEGVTCQDCHMTPDVGVTKPNPGKAASTGPDREHIYSMTFAGGNVALGDAALAEANLKAAADLTLDVPEVVESGDVPVAVTITNVGAGHYLPTGLTEVRLMWLEVTAVDEAGTELLNERRDFHTVLEDAEGNHPAEMWEAVAIHSDDRIPPKESVSNDYTFPMAAGPVTVTAALYYRSCPEEMAAAAGVEVPTTTMAQVTRTVYASAQQQADDEPATDEAEPEPEADGETPSSLVYILIVAAVAVIAAAAYFVIRRSKK